MSERRVTIDAKPSGCLLWGCAIEVVALIVVIVLASGGHP